MSRVVHAIKRAAGPLAVCVALLTVPAVAQTESLFTHGVACGEPAGELSPIGTCRTAPDPDVISPVTFGFSGDADWKWRPYPIVNALNQESLDFFLFLGDTIYETTNPDGTEVAEDLNGYRAK